MNDVFPSPPPTAERYALAMESINEGVYDFDATTGSIYYVPQLSAMLGLPPEELRTVEDWTGRIHPDDLPSYHAAWRDLYAAGSVRLACEYRYRAHDGNWRWARQHGIAVRGENGRVQRVVGAAGDITDIKEREREAQEEQTAVAEVLQIIGNMGGDPVPAFHAILAHATLVCEADVGTLWVYEGDGFRAVASHDAPPPYAEFLRDKVRPGPESALTRAVRERRLVHVADAAAGGAYR